MVNHLMKLPNTTVMLEIHTLVPNKIATDAIHAVETKLLIEPTTDVLKLSQDQVVHATSSSMPKTNARHAQPTNFQLTEVPVLTILVSSDMPIQLPGTSKYNKPEIKEEP
jgi:hypothetical protein